MINSDSKDFYTVGKNEQFPQKVSAEPTVYNADKKKC